MKTSIPFYLVGVGLIGGCSVNLPTADNVAQDSPAKPQSELGKGFLDITYVLQPSIGFNQVEGTTMELLFSRDAEGVVKMWFSAGCNNFNADVLITSEELRPTDGIKYTEMGCDQSRHAQDEWLRIFMMNAPRLSVSSDRLTLYGESATLVFLDKNIANPDRPLSGRVWTATQFIEQDSLSWLSLDSYPTLSFSEDGKLVIFDGCNHLEGNFVINGEQLSLTNMMTVTTHPCSIQNVLRISAHYQELFVDGIVTYSIDANILRIQRGKNGVAANTE